MTTSEAAALLRAELFSSQRAVPPDHVIQEANTLPLENVHCVYAVPLLRGTTSDAVFFPGTNQWMNYKRDEVSSVPMVAVQIMLLAAENLDNGAQFIKVDRFREAGLYARVVEAYALRKLGWAKKKHHDLVERYVEGHTDFSISMQRDILDAINAAKAGGEEAAAEVRPIPLGAAPPAPVDILDRLGPSAINGVAAGDIISGNRTPGTLFEHMSEQQLTPADAPIFSMVPEAAAPAAVVNGDDDEGNLNQLEAGAQGNDWFNKVKFTLTPIGTHGYLFQCHVWDASWNKGVEVDRLIHAAKIRNAGTSLNTRFQTSRDPLDKYAIFEGTGFPSHGFTRDKYVRMCNTYVPGLLSQEDFANESRRGVFSSFESRLHPSKIFTLERALAKFRDAGAPAELCIPRLWYEHGVSKWPAGLTAYHYQSDAAKWYDKTQVGLAFQFLPDCVPMRDVRSVLSLIESRIVDRGQEASNETFVQEVRDAVEEAEAARDKNSATAQRIMHVSEVQAEQQSTIQFATANELVFCAFEAERLERQLQGARPAILDDTLLRVQDAIQQGIWPDGVSPELRAAHDVCFRYQSMVRISRGAQMDRLIGMCQLEGDMSILPISKTARTTLEWYRDRKMGDAPFSRGFKLVDPQMSFLGNTVIKTQALYDRFGRIIQPVIPMLVEGLMSVYEWAPRKLAFNLIIHGPAAGGKTHSLINTPLKVRRTSLNLAPRLTRLIVDFYPSKLTATIIGTVVTDSFATDKADLTDTPIEDEIRMQDEVEQLFVDPVIAEHPQNVNKTNRFKEAMTNGYLTTRCYKEVVIPGSKETKRSYRVIVTMQNYVRACCTNKAIGDPSALSSRFHCRTMYSTKVSDELRNEATIYFQKLQFCSLWAKKAAMVGALPQKGPDMSVWDDVTGRMQEYLKRRGIHIDEGSWTRSLDKMAPFAKQLIYSQAQMYTFDLPSSPHYGKPFKPEMLTDMGPHLYCTKEMVLYVITLLADEIIRDDFSNVLRAMLSVMNLQWGPDFSPYDAATRSKNLNFRHRLNREQGDSLAGPVGGGPMGGGGGDDGDQSAPPLGGGGGFKRRKTASEAIASTSVAANPANEQDKFLLDLNQLVLSGTSIPVVLDQIAAKTNPKLGPNDCYGVLKHLTHVSTHVSSGGDGRNGYAAVPRETFRRLHARIQVPREQLVIERWKNTCLDKYALRHFRRAASKLTNVDEEMRKTPEAWEELHRELAMSSEEIIILHLAGPRKTMHSKELRAWLDQTVPIIGEAFPITDLECSAICIADGSVSPQELYAQLSWAQIKTLGMALDDGMFFHPESSNKSAQYSEPVCHGWQGDYRECDLADLNTGKFESDGTAKTSRDMQPVVELEPSKSRIYFNPAAIDMFDKQIIVDAWIYATMCDTFAPQKYILGWMHEEDLTKFDVLDITEELRDKLVQQLVAEGPHEAYRSQGLKFNRRGFINESDAKILFSVPFNGLPNAAFTKQASTECLARSQLTEIIDSVDDRAAYAQHLACGRPLDEPVQTPGRRRAEYIRAWNANPMLNADSALGDLNYPMDPIMHSKEQARVWNHAQVAVPSFANSIRETKRRDERKAIAIHHAKRARSDKGKEEASVNGPAPASVAAKAPARQKKKSRVEELMQNQ